MPLDQSFGTPFRVTATGTVCITSANAALLGILFQGTGTGSLKLFAGVTATLTSNVAAGVTSAINLGRIVAYATVTGATANAAVYYPFPAVCSGGITVVMEGSADPSVTLFWNPTGG
jgi:hypothetical protein